MRSPLLCGSIPIATSKGARSCPRTLRTETPPRHRSQNAWDYNARVGLLLFAVYLALYGGFIDLSAFNREVMARPSLGGMNLAIVYGFALIVAAFVLAVVYMFLCKPEPAGDDDGTARRGGAGVKYTFSWTAFAVFVVFVGCVLGLSFYLGRKAKSAKGYFAAHGQVGWFVNGIAFAGDYLSAASFLGICGMIAFYGYDGFLYSIGYLAGWVVALFVIAEPIKRLGQVHLRRRAGQPVQLPRHQARRGDQHAGGQPLLPDPADGRRGRADQAAARAAALGGRA